MLCPARFTSRLPSYRHLLVAAENGLAVKSFTRAPQSFGCRIALLRRVRRVKTDPRKLLAELHAMDQMDQMIQQLDSKSPSDLIGLGARKMRRHEILIELGALDD